MQSRQGMGNAEKMLGCTTLQHNMGESFGRHFANYDCSKGANAKSSEVCINLKGVRMQNRLGMGDAENQL